jgi:rare lipoprotein A
MQAPSRLAPATPPEGHAAAARPRRLCAAGLLAAVLLAACASTPPPDERDGPPLRVPPDLHRTPDAQPRIEPIRAGGPNRPYEVLGRRHVPFTDDRPLVETGGASWYGRKFHGRPTSSGEPYDMFAMTAAHKTMPIPSYARVRNPANGREIIVRINDRGPFVEGRIIDLSYVAALRLGVLGGVTPVQVRRLTFDEIRALQASAERARELLDP